MYKDILNEELGISNSVSLLTLKIKNLISNDYAKNFNDYSLIIEYEIIKNLYINLYKNVLNVTFESKDIKIIYYVLNTDNQNLINFYNSKCNSNFSDNSMILFLSCNLNNNKINWPNYSGILQHEVEHYFQSYKKNSILLSPIKQQKYNQYVKLAKSNDYIDAIIGFTYYYYTKIEQNAIMNQLYREIMDNNKDGLRKDPKNILINNIHYSNINTIKKFINSLDNDNINKDSLKEHLTTIGKSYNSFVKTANIVINEYIKKFGRTLYKANKDIDKLYENVLY